MKRTLVTGLAAAATLLTLAGCSAADADQAATDTPAPAPDERVLTVYAAASLTEVFGDLEAAYEAAHPEIDVVTVFGGSSELAATILEGAPADVFASANEKQMDVALEETAAEPRIFATNVLTVIVEPGNPLNITGLGDLAREDVVSVVCAEQVPCGAATVKLADLQGIALAPSSQENSVTDVLGKVASGQADAGVVYVTDVARSEDVEQVTIDGADAAINLYPIAPLTNGDSPDLAQSFVDLVLSDEGQETLAAAGFGAP
ncbi:molybdate ABC transporter substrate-binding protein [Demequina sp.]|uniref:molybdate ABC transporter substrate-binding protein n=1 Tax=Demequina sp. TaxID=2050685 RepID=UPI003A850D10